MFALLLAALLTQNPPADIPPLEGTIKSEPYDFEMGLPKGWETSRTGGATFFRAQAPAGSIADGATWLAHHDSNHPVTLAYVVDVFLKRAASEYPGFKKVTERDATVAGYPARQVVFGATGRGQKSLVFVHTIIQRQLQEFFIFDVVGLESEKERLVGLSDRMLASFRTGLPPSTDRERRAAATARLLKEAPAGPNLAGTQWHELIVGQQKLGWQKHTLREAKVDGAPGWEFEIESRQEDAEGGTRVDLSTGAFTVDGSVQRVEVRRTVRTPKDAPVDVKETASLRRGAYRSVREFLDQKTEKELKLPEGTYLGDVAETIRRFVALSPPGKNALRILEPFRDLTSIEEWEHTAAARMRVDGEEREVIQALVTNDRRDPVEYLFDPDGSLRRKKSGGGFMVLNRVTEEEARRR